MISVTSVDADGRAPDAVAATAGDVCVGVTRLGRGYVGSVAVVTGEVESQSMSMMHQLESR